MEDENIIHNRSYEIKAEMDKLKSLISEENKYKDAFLRNIDLFKDILNDEFENKIQAYDRIYKINLFKYCGLEDAEDKKVKLQDIYSGCICFQSNTEEESLNKKEEYLKKYDIKKYKEKSVPRGEKIITELLVEGELWAWVECKDYNDGKYYLYISRSKDVEYHIRLNIIDFIEVFNKEEYHKEAQKSIFNAMNIKIKNVESIKEVCSKNINIIDTKFHRYNYLNMLTSQIQTIVKEIINFIKDEAYFFDTIDKKYYVFFSNNYIAEKLKKSKNSINKYINLFIALELIEKETRKEEKNGNKNKTCLYYVKEFTDDNLKNANSLAEVIFKNGIKSSSFDYQACKKIFGEEKADTIFLDTNLKKKSKRR